MRGGSSLVARWAHNPKVVGSNPTPATTYDRHCKLRDPFPRGSACTRGQPFRQPQPIYGEHSLIVYCVGRQVFILESVGSTPREATMNTEMIKLAAKALMVDTKGRWGNWEFNWELIRELHEITEDSEFPVGMEEVESVLIALTKLS